MKLDLSSFEKALARLKRGIVRSQAAPRDEELRDSVIQRFECTYELSWKMLKRQLESSAATPVEIDALGFKDLIREGAVQGVISNPEAWFEYRKQRNATSHTYDEKKAIQVYQTALRFVADAQALFEKLKERQSGA